MVADHCNGEFFWYQHKPFSHGTILEVVPLNFPSARCDMTSAQ